jgi:hypothetical protein
VPRRLLTPLALILVFGSLAVLALAPSAEATLDSTPEAGLVADGPVDAIAVSGENVYLGGSFTTIGPRTGQGVVLNSELSSWDTATPQVGGGTGEVNVVISDGEGGWYVGGSFTEVGGLPRSNLAHILADDTVDPNFHPEPDGTIQELALSGSTLFAAGQFETIGAQKRKGLAAVETTTGVATAFAPEPNNDEDPCGLAVDGNYVFVCGGFTEIGGQERKGFTQLNASDGSVTAWGLGVEGYDRVSNLYLGPTSVLYMDYYGKFADDPSETEYEGVAAVQIAAEPDQPPTFLPFHPNIGEVSAFLQIGSTLYVGGEFNSIAYAPPDKETENFTIYERENTAAFDVDKNYELLPFEAHVDGHVTELADGAGNLYVGGYFGRVGGEPRTNLSSVDPTTGVPTGVDPDIDGNVHAIAASGPSLYVGGTFLTVGGSTRNHVAAIDAATGELESFDPEVNGTVQALAVDGSTLYVGGGFGYAAGAGEEAPRSNLAAFTTSTGSLTSFAPEPNGTVNALAVSGSTLYAGGSFNRLHEVEHGSLVAFSTIDGSLESFEPSPNGSVDALAVSSGRLYAAGSFSQLSGVSGLPARSDLAAFELPSGTLDMSFEPPAFERSVLAVAANGSSVYVGGDFDYVGATYQPRLVALSAADGSLQAWDPEVSDDVDALALDGSTLYAGGPFNDAGGFVRGGLAGLSTVTGRATSFDPEPNEMVSALALTEHGLYAGGTFTAVGTTNQPYFAAFASTSDEQEAEAEDVVAGNSSELGSASEGSDAGSSALSSTPLTFITSGPAYYTSARQETFTFASDVAGASFRCSLDGAPAVTCSSPYKTGALALGAHRFVVQSVAPSGAVDIAGASESFVVTEAVASSALIAPVLSHVKVPGRIRRAGTRKARHLKSTVRFSLTKEAVVTLTLRRIEHVACHAHRSCNRSVLVATIMIHGHAGSNRVIFAGWVGKRALPTGGYRATLVASLAGASSKPVKVHFRLVGDR